VCARARTRCDIAGVEVRVYDMNVDMTDYVCGLEGGGGGSYG